MHKLLVEGDCWLWTKCKNSDGYGRMRVNGVLEQVHRVSYEIFVGPIPEGLELDHTCRNRACINPAHLEPVTHLENVRRGRRGGGGQNKKISDNLDEAWCGGECKSFLSKEESLDYFQEMLVLYEPYKLAQRILAIMFSSVFLFVHLIVAITHFIYVLRGVEAKQIIELYQFNNDSLGTIVLIIISFYFAGGVLEGTVKRFQEKKKGNKK